MNDFWTPCEHFQNCIGFCPYCAREHYEAHLARNILKTGETCPKNAIEQAHWEGYAKPFLESMLRP